MWREIIRPAFINGRSVEHQPAVYHRSLPAALAPMLRILAEQRLAALWLRERRGSCTWGGGGAG
jgi:hypothetical protein